MINESKIAFPPEKLRLKIIEEASQEAQKAIQNKMEQMRPVFERAIEAYQPMIKLNAAINTTIAAPLTGLQEAMKLVLRIINQQAAFLSEPMFKKETFVLPPPRRYPSAEEVAEVIWEKIEARNETIKPKIIEITTEKPVVALPDGTNWDDLKIDFKDRYTLSVSNGNIFIGYYDCVALGFARQNTKDKKPDKQWQFLSQLAIITEFQDRGHLKPTIETLAHHLKITRSACEKIKESLSRKLQIAFGIKSSPFYPYNKETGYRTRFTLQPEPDYGAAANCIVRAANYTKKLLKPSFLGEIIRS